MATTGNYRLKNPPHPDGFVRTEIIEPMGLSVMSAAEVLGITPAALSEFINGISSLSSDMALRIEKAFGVRMDTLMRMQNSYEIAQARKREGEINVVRYVPKEKVNQQPYVLRASMEVRHNKSESVPG